MIKMTAGLAEANVHHEVMLVTIDMAMLEVAEMIVAALAIDITMMVVLVMTVASPQRQ